MERFYDPTEGVVRFDGVPIPEWNLVWLRGLIGLVSQEPVLFDASVWENIEYGLAGSIYVTLSRDEKDKMIRQACDIANATEFIIRLPKGFDTNVGERGLLLSGGQKQRLAIARAVVKNPKVLLLDEATSALDTASEVVVQEALDRASLNRTTIVIAHRLSTIKNANKIIVMDKGAVVEEGTHDSLIESKGLYCALVEAQRISQRKDQTDGQDTQNPSIPNTVVDVNALVTAPLKSPPFQPEETTKQTRALDLEMGGGGQPMAKEEKHVFSRVARLNSPELVYIVLGALASIIAGSVYPVFAIVFGSILQTFADPNPENVRNGTNFWASMFVAIAAVTLVSSFCQSFLFSLSGEKLTTRIRKMYFKALVRQNIAYFDDPLHSVGSLTSIMATDATYIKGITGGSLGSLLNIFVNIIGGLIVALVYGYKLTLVIMSCLPVLIAAGAIRMQMVNGYTIKTQESYESSAKTVSEVVWTWC